MKRIFLGLVFLLLSQPLFAQSLEFELLRTKEVPGFFVVRIFPNKNLQPLNIQNVFVKDFSKKENNLFEPILPIIREFGGKIIEKNEIEKFKNQNYRLIYLGKNQKDELSFFPSEEEKILDEFEVFSEENLGQIFLENLSIKFGGNISEVYPSKIDFLGKDPVFFVGKFEKKQKTRMEIQAVSQEGEISAITPLHLEKFEDHELTEALPKIWEEAYKESQPKETIYSLKWLTLFPWFLGILGVFFIFIALKNIFPFSKKIKKEEEMPEEFWHQPLKSKSVENNLPFTVEKKNTFK